MRGSTGVLTGKTLPNPGIGKTFQIRPDRSDRAREDGQSGTAQKKE